MLKTVAHVIALVAVMIPGAAITLHSSTAAAAPSATSKSSATCASLKVDATVPADVRAVEKAVGEMLGCKDIARDPALAFWTDAPNASQLARLAVVADCLPADIDRPRDLVEALRCHPDLALLDRAKLDAELEADARFDAAAKTTLRETFERTRAKADTWTKQASALAATSPEARAVLFDAPRRAAAEWNTAYVANREAVDAALLFSAKIGTEGARGCSTAMRQHLATYLGKKSAKTPAASAAAMTEPVGYPIVDALAQCEQVDGEPLAAQALGTGVLGKSPRWHRGPRVAAYWAGLDALDASDGAQRIFGASFGVFRKFPRAALPVAARPAQEREQVVASIRSARGGTAIVTFEASTASLYVAAAHATGLAAGRKVIYLQDGARAFPTTVFADKDKKTPVAFMGTLLPGAPSTPALPAAPADKKIRRTAHR